MDAQPNAGVDSAQDEAASLRPIALRLVGLLAVLPLLLVGPALLPGRTLLPQHPAAFAPLSHEDPARAGVAREDANYLASDALFPFLTDARAMRSAVGEGVLPSWTPDLGAGMPLSAGSLASPWYPPNWLHLLLPAHVAVGWIAFGSLVVAGLGMLLFLMSRGHSAGAQIFGAFAYQVGAFAIVNLHLGMKVQAALWLPWCLWAVEGALRERPYSRSLLALFTALSFLAGFPPIAVFVLATTVVYTLVRALATREDFVVAIPAFLRIAAFLAVGVAGAGVSLLPMAEASQRSTRGAREASDLAAESLPGSALGTMLAPGLFGSATDPLFAPHNPMAWLLVSEDEPEKALTANALEWNVHAGVVCLLLALAGLAGSPRRALLPAALLVGVLGFAFGQVPFRWLYAVPGFDLGAPSRALAIAWCLWPWLAAIGVEALLCRRLSALAMAVIAGLGSLFLGLGLWAGIDAERFGEGVERALVERHGRTVEEVRAFVSREDSAVAAERLVVEGRWLFYFALGAVACAAGTFVLGRGRGRLGFGLLAAWVLLVASEGTRLAREHLVPRRVAGPLFPPSETIDAIRAAAGTGRVVRIDESESGVGDVLELARPNLLSAYGVRDLTPYVVFPPRDLVELVGEVDPDSLFRGGISGLSGTRAIGHPALDVLRVTCVLSRAPVEHARLELVHEREGFHVYRRTGPDGSGLPEAAVFDNARHSKVPVISHLAATPPSFDPAELCFLDSRPPAEPDRPPAEAIGGPDWEPGEIVVSRPSSDRVDVAVRGSGGGYLVMYDAWHPGWKATVNGEDAEVHRAQHLVRAVRIPAGDSIVRTKYEPWSARFGTLLTVVAFFAVSFVAFRERRAARRRAML